MTLTSRATATPLPANSSPTCARGGWGGGGGSIPNQAHYAAGVNRLPLRFVASLRVVGLGLIDWLGLIEMEEPIVLANLV
jgi:hypothetical protein